MGLFRRKPEAAKSTPSSDGGALSEADVVAAVAEMSGEVVRHQAKVIGYAEWPGRSGTDALFALPTRVAATDTAIYVFEGPRRIGGRTVATRHVFKFSEITNPVPDLRPPASLDFNCGAQTVRLLDQFSDPGWEPLLKFWARTMMGPAEQALLEPVPRQDAWPNLARPYPIDISSIGGFTYVERFWFVPGESPDSGYATCQQVAELLIEATDAGFEGVLRDENGRRLSPRYLDVQDAWIDGESGDCVMLASLTHRALGLPEAFDLGARDGSNMNGWNGAAPGGVVFPNKHVFIGSAASGVFGMSEVWASADSVDVSPDGRWCATVNKHVLDNSGITNAVSLIDRQTGSRSVLTAVWHYYSGPVSFSPDSEWLLISGLTPSLVRVSDGRKVPLSALPFPSRRTCEAAWWPTDGSKLAIVGAESEDGGPVLHQLDLASNELTRLGPIDIPGADQLSADQRSIWDLVLAPDARSALFTTRVVAPSQGAASATRFTRVARLNLDSLDVEVLSDPFLDEAGRIQREQTKPRWVGRAAPTPTVVGDALMAQSEPPEPLAGGSPKDWANDAHNVVGPALKAAALNQTPHILRPEILRLLAAVKAYGPDLYSSAMYVDDPAAEFGGWAKAVADAVRPDLEAGVFDRVTRDAWTKLLNGITLIHQGRASEIDWESDAYLTPGG